MLIVPVIDIKAGTAVRAIGGLRAEYKPVRSALCNSTQPADLVEAYLRLHPFPIIYLADLDAITGGGGNGALIRALITRFTETVFWIDAGFRSKDSLAGYQHRQRSRIVLGSESLVSVHDYEALRGACHAEPILSLDYKNGSFLGPERLLRETALWTNEIIVMALDRVGRNCGPWPHPPAVARHAESRRVYAAGGARGLDDLRSLAQSGYAGALVASALLDLRLGSAELALMSGGTPPLLPSKFERSGE